MEHTKDIQEPWPAAMSDGDSQLARSNERPPGLASHPQHPLGLKGATVCLLHIKLLQRHVIKQFWNNISNVTNENALQYSFILLLLNKPIRD